MTENQAKDIREHNAAISRLGNRAAPPKRQARPSPRQQASFRTPNSHGRILFPRGATLVAC